MQIFSVDYGRFEKPRSYLASNSPTKSSASLNQQENLNAKIIRHNIKWFLPGNSRETCTASRAAWLIDWRGLLAVWKPNTPNRQVFEFNRAHVSVIQQAPLGGFPSPIKHELGSSSLSRAFLFHLDSSFHQIHRSTQEAFGSHPDGGCNYN